MYYNSLFNMSKVWMSSNTNNVKEIILGKKRIRKIILIDDSWVLLQISKLLEFIKRDWFEQENMKEFEIMKKYAKDGRMYSLMIISESNGINKVI